MHFTLRHTGDGRLEAIKPSQRQEIIARFKVGDNIACDLEKYRSNLQNRAFFAAISKAYDNTPHTDRWRSSEELRAWCFVQVGFKETIECPMPQGMRGLVKRFATFVSAIVTRVHAKDRFAFMRETPDGLAVDIPRSWQFSKTDHSEATKVMDAVLDLLVTEVVPGITRKQLLEAVHKDAA